jgi:exportin-2 (importin alpha re-exporter)
VFQILAQLLESSLLMPPLWQQAANIPALVRLLQAYLEKGGIPIHSPQTVQQFLGVFQKLIASKAHDHEGFYLLNSMVEYVPRTVLEPYMRQVFLLLLNRLQNSKTVKFLRGFIYLISLFIALTDSGNGVTFIVTVLDTVQPRLFYMILDNIYLSDVAKMPTLIEKKVCAVAMIKLLTECPLLLDDTYFGLWPKILTTLIRLFEAPEVETELMGSDNLSAGDDDIIIDGHGNILNQEDDGTNLSGYNVIYTHLAYSKRRPHDALKNIEDPKIFLARSLYELSKAHPGRFPPVISHLSEENIRFLNHYLQRAGIYSLS